MDEDETVVLKNTGLYTHLRESGFTDFEIVEQCKPSPEPLLPDIDDSSCENMNPVEHFQNFEKLVNIILESHLVFNDDVLFVKNFALHVKPLTKTSNILFSDLTVQTVFVSSSCLACSACGVKLKPWILFSLHMIPLSFHSIKHLYLAYCKRKRRKVLERMLRNLKKLSLLMQKSLQFVYESEILTYDDPLDKRSSSNVAQVGELQIMQHLRTSIFHAIRSAVLDFKRLIIVLIENFPLKTHVQSLSYHLAFLDEIDLQCAYSQETTSSISVQQLQKMKYVCLLLQSEFLRQLSLCFIPSLWVSGADSILQNIFVMLTDFSERCWNRYQQLKSIFEVYYTCEKTSTNLSSSPDAKWLYKEAYVKSCSLSFNLQSVLKDSRMLEEFLEETRASNAVHDQVVKQLENMSAKINRNYLRSQTALEDLQRYVAGLKPKNSASCSAVETGERAPSPVKTNVLLGVSDFNPTGSDEVFVGLAEEGNNVGEKETALGGEEATLKPPKLFLSELKGALQNKAKEWKEREKIALKNKNIDIDDDELIDVRLPGKMDSSSEEELSSIQRQSVLLPESNYKFKPIPVAESSFAKKIQETSAAWGLRSEEFIGDEDEDEEE